MLWVALHFSVLPLEIFSRGADISGPFAVVEKQGSRTWVKACNEAAGACGVRPGMLASAAQALADGLVLRQRELAAEAEALTGLAAWAGRFTPAVSLQPPDGLLLEVESCLRLHGGLENLLGMVRGGLAELGYACTVACAPTPHGAWLLALAGAEVAIREPGRLAKALGALPVRLLDQPQKVLDSLHLVGADTVGECLRLPRAGMARRFGTRLMNELDRAVGSLPEAREFFEPPPSFERRMELPAPVHEAEALVFAARRLLPELEGYLNLRQAGVQEFELVCQHERRADTVLKLGFVQPTRSLERMQLLLRETLAATTLPAPVHTLALNARLILPLDVSSGDLFDDSAEAAAGTLLLERLRVRMGKEAVFGIRPAADHRPERAWRRCEAGEAAKETAVLKRPLWLLPKPVPCEPRELSITAGPERIESGWWDGRDVARDYYVARDGSGARVWVYRDRLSEAWFVQGLFS